MNGLQQVRQLRVLAGTNDSRIDDMYAAASRLRSIIEGWQAFPPRAANLLDAEYILDGLCRSLAEIKAEHVQHRATWGAGDAA